MANGNGERKWHDHGWFKTALAIMTAGGLSVGGVSLQGQQSSSQVVDSLNREMDQRDDTIRDNTDNIRSVEKDIARIDANLRNVEEDVDTMQSDLKTITASQIRQEEAFKTMTANLIKWMKTMQNDSSANGDGHP